MDSQLSIIVPVYNAEDYLYRNIMTLINQTVSSDKYEIILVNDGSVDRSGQICEELSAAYHNVSYIFKKNGGVSSARNAGMDVAVGTYITFVDSDDYVSDHYVETILHLMSSQADLGMFNCHIVSEQGESTIREWVTAGAYDMEKIYALLFAGRSNMPWDKVFKRSIITKHKVRFPEDMYLGEDLVFTLRYVRHVCSTEILDIPLYYYKETYAGLSGRKTRPEAVYQFDRMFREMTLFLQEMKCDAKTVMDGRRLMLQIITNFAGKLKKNGMNNSEIDNVLLRCTNYKELLTYHYSDIRSKIRCVLMKMRQYGIVSCVFRG